MSGFENTVADTGLVISVGETGLENRRGLSTGSQPNLSSVGWSGIFPTGPQCKKKKSPHSGI